MYGVDSHLNNAQLTRLKNECCLIDVAPTVEPNLLVGSLTNSCVIKSLAGPGTTGSFGNSMARTTMLAKVNPWSSPLKGAIPYNNSNMNIPNVQQSTTFFPCTSPDTIFGAKYSWVPTNEIDSISIGFPIISRDPP